MKTLNENMKYQIGVDLAEVERIAGSLEKFGQKFKDRNFSKDEIAYCDNKRTPAVHYAGRWAAKEAFLKAVGIGIMRGAPLNELSLIPPEGKTRPVMSITGDAETLLIGKLHVSSWDINITHTKTLAMAAAVVFFSEPKTEND